MAFSLSRRPAHERRPFMWLNTCPERCRTRQPAPGVEQLEDRTLPSNFAAATVPELIADINAANLTPEADTITLAPGKTFTLTAVNNTTDGSNGLPVVASGEDLT